MTSGHRLFFREFLRQFHSTGAVLPSGRALAAALARYIRAPADGPRRILEVGPGTGAVTARIVRDLQPQDEFHLVELNDRFVEHLRQRFEQEPAFQAVQDRANIVHGRLEDLPAGETYDVIVSCLPLNNFGVADVEGILEQFSRMVRPGGALSFFEYMAIRRIKCSIGNRADRERLQGITCALNRVLDRHEVRCDWIWPNVPPAWVHHVQFAGAESASVQNETSRTSP